MAKTFLDELVEYPAKAIQKLGTNQDIVSLLTVKNILMAFNNASIDPVTITVGDKENAIDVIVKRAISIDDRRDTPRTPNLQKRRCGFR